MSHSANPPLKRLMLESFQLLIRCQSVCSNVIFSYSYIINIANLLIIYIKTCEWIGYMCYILFSNFISYFFPLSASFLFRIFNNIINKLKLYLLFLMRIYKNNNDIIIKNIFTISTRWDIRKDFYKLVWNIWNRILPHICFCSGWMGDVMNHSDKKFIGLLVFFGFQFV